MLAFLVDYTVDFRVLWSNALGLLSPDHVLVAVETTFAWSMLRSKSINHR